MKAVITKGGLYTWINTRENSFLQQYFEEDTNLEQQSLTEREQYIAQTLVTRGVLEKLTDNGAVKYKLNKNKMV